MCISEEEKNVGKTTKVNLKPRKCKAICEGKYRRQAEEVFCSYFLLESTMMFRLRNKNKK